MVLCAWSPGGGLPSSLLCSVNLHYGWGNETQLIQYPSKYSLYYFRVFETNIFHYDRILDYFSWFSTILGDWNQCISLHIPRFCCFTPWMVLRKKKRVFPGHGVTPSHHPVQVMDDHDSDLVLKQPWWRLRIPHDWRTPHIIIHHHFLPVLIMIFSIKSHNKWNLQMT